MIRWQFPGGRKLSTYVCERPPFYDQSGVPFAISRDGSHAAIGGFSGTVIMVNLDTGTELWRSEGTDGRGYSLAFSPDGKTLAIGTSSHTGYILLLDAATGRERQRLIGHRNAVSALVYSADGTRLFSASFDQRIGLWDLRDPVHVPSARLLRGHKIEVWSLALLADGRTLASSSKDGEVLLWDSVSGRRESSVTSDEIPRDSGWCLSVEGEAMMGVNLATRELLEWRGTGHALQRTPLLLETGANRACWSHDGRFLAVGGTNGSVQIWNASERRLAGQFAVGTNAVVPLQFDRKSQRLAVVAENTFELWTLAPFRKSLSTNIPAGHQVIDYSGYVFFAPVLAPDLDLVPMYRGPKFVGGSMSLWSPATGRIVKLTEDSESSRDPDGGITEIAFSPDGALVALCGFSGETRVHDTRTGSRLASLRGFFTGASTACFSPDGRRLAIGGDGEIKIYHTATWRELITLATGAGWLSNLQFSRTGDSVRVRGDDLTEQKDVGKLQDWRVPSFEEIAAAEAKEKTEINQP